MDSLDLGQVVVVAGLSAAAVFFLILTLSGIVQLFSGYHPGRLAGIAAFAIITLLLGGGAYGLRSAET